MTTGRISASSTGYGFFTFPPEVRNMIYYYLLKAFYIDLDWPSCRGHSRIFTLLRVMDNVTRPESERLSILRVSRRLHYEAMYLLYRHNTFCFGVRYIKQAPSKPLGAEAISMIQHVDIRVDTSIYQGFCSRPERKKRILSQLRGLGDSHAPRKRCHVTLYYSGGYPRHISPKRLIRELSTPTSFELLILDANTVDWDSDDGYTFLPSSWPWFQTYVEGMEYELGPGVYDAYEGNFCVTFHP